MSRKKNALSLIGLLLAVSCTADQRSKSNSRSAPTSPDDDKIHESQSSGMSEDTSGFSLADLAAPNAWVNLLTSPTMRGTSEISTSPSLNWSLQKFKVFVGPMVSYFDREITLTPPRAGENAAVLFNSVLSQLTAATADNKSVSVKVSPGVYRFESLRPNVRDRTPAIHFNGLSRVKVSGTDPLNPPKFVFTNPYAEGILIENCNLVELSNVTIDYEYPATYGKVAYLGRSLGSGYIQSHELFNPRYGGPTGSALDAIGAVFSFDTTENKWFSGTSAKQITFEGSAQPTLINTSTTPTPALTPTPTPIPNTFYDSRLSSIPARSEVMILHTRTGFAPAVYANGRGNEYILLKKIKIHSYPQMGVLISGGKGFWLDEIVIEPSPGKSVSGRADGIHIAGIQGDILIENSRVSGQGDDGLNIHGVAHSVSAVSSSGLVRLNGPNIPAIGDRLALMTIGNKPLYSAVISSVETVETGVFDVNLHWGGCNASCQQNLFAERDFDPVDGRSTTARIGIAYTVNLSSSRYIIRNNEFSKSGGRGVIVEAPNGILDANVIEKVAGSGIAIIATNSYFLSGLGAVNVKISRTRITDSSYSDIVAKFPLEGAIAVMTPILPGAFPLLQSIVIRDSVVNRVGLPFASVLRGTNILFTGNQATNYGLSEKPGLNDVRILLRSSAGVTILDRVVATP